MLCLFIPISSNLVPTDSTAHTKVRASFILQPFVAEACHGSSITDWFFFLVLDIGTPAISSIPVGVRILIGLLQATAVRAAGFGTVALSALAPAVK